MLALLRSTGCSLEELVALRVGDVDRAAHRVQFTSYSESWQSQLDRRTWEMLEGYLEDRSSAVGGVGKAAPSRAIGMAFLPRVPHADEYIGWRPGEGEEDESLFRDADGAPLTVERAYEMLLEYAAQVGVGEDELRRTL